MQINVTGHHIEVTPALRAYATEKLQRISRHTPGWRLRTLQFEAGERRGPRSDHSDMPHLRDTSLDRPQESGQEDSLCRVRDHRADC